MARRGAPPLVLDDDSPLDGSRLRVDVRIGWVLRTARTTAPASSGAPAPARLSDMVTALAGQGVPTSAATLHRLETGQLRSGLLVEGYEQTLGLTHGALRAPVDAYCRTFPHGPPDRDPGRGVATVAAMDALLDRVVGGTAEGGDWLRWARALAQPHALGLPTLLAAPLVGRLVSEMGRSSGAGYMARYEALSLIRRSAYGGVVVDVARSVLAAPHPQVVLDLMSAVGESPADDVVDWLVELLDDPRDLVVSGAVVGLENLAATSADPTVWRRSAEPLVRASNAREPDSRAWRWLSHLVRVLPPPTRVAVEPRLTHPPAPAPAAASWTRTRLNEHWSTCEILAGRVTDALGLPEQPVLTRLLLELAMGEEETRAITGGMLLSALPAVAEGVADALTELAETHPDPLVRERSARRLAAMQLGRVPDPVRAWWATPGPLQATGLKIAGTAGQVVDTDVLRAALDADDEDLQRQAMSAAGLAQDPLLTEVAADPARPDSVRGAAQWWLDEGGRVPR